MAEIKIKCPNCFSEEKCFEETVVRENEDDFKSYLCFHCGFTSNSFYTKDNKARAQHLETTAELIKELEFFDEERQIYWYPSVINMGPEKSSLRINHRVIWHIFLMYQISNMSNRVILSFIH